MSQNEGDAKTAKQQMDDITKGDDDAHKPKEEPGPGATASPSPSPTQEAGSAPGGQGSQPQPSNTQRPATREELRDDKGGGKGNA